MFRNCPVLCDLLVLQPFGISTAKHHFTPTSFFIDTFNIPIHNHFVALLLSVLMIVFHLTGVWISVILATVLPWSTHEIIINK